VATVIRLVAVGVLALGCGTSERLVVGAKNFTEQRILGELVAQTAERAGIEVLRRLDLGGTFVCDAALRAGEIDVYVEYTGTALTAVLKAPPDTDPVRVRAAVADAYRTDGLAWMAPLGFDNTFALVVRPDATARTISEAVAPARAWRAGFGYEFQSRPDGFPALARAYGLAFREIRTMDLGLLYPALAAGEIDLAVGSATDALIDAKGFRVLADDRRAFPPYEAAPVVRAAALARYPALAAALGGLAGAVDARAMRAMNLAVDGEHRDPAEVVRAFLDARPVSASSPSADAPRSAP
jgi:glycine betaine/choline ABC-type transport system substrate-binding protein